MINIDNKIHYEKKEWIDYIDGKLDDETSRKMEDHLYNCDNCLLVYSQLCEATEPDINSVSPDFTNKIMNSISTKRKNSKLKLSVYYAVAASIAISLTYTGFFNSIFKFSTQSERTVSFVSSKTNTAISQNLSKLNRLGNPNKSINTKSPAKKCQ